MGFGVGLVRITPGTFGTLAAWGIYLGLAAWGIARFGSPALRTDLYVPAQIAAAIALLGPTYMRSWEPDAVMRTLALLAGIGDMERLTARARQEAATPRELIALRDALVAVPTLVTMLHDAASNVRVFGDFPWLLSPAFAMFVVVLGLNLVLQRSPAQVVYNERR